MLNTVGQYSYYMENCGNETVSLAFGRLGRDVKAVRRKEKKVSGKYFMGKNIICDVSFHFIIYSARALRHGNSYNGSFR